jgi:hypothetical protein
MSPISAMAAGIAGFSRAREQLATSAAEIARAGAQDRFTASGEHSAPDVVGALTDLRVARYTAMANLKVVRTAADVEEGMIRELAR